MICILDDKNVIVNILNTDTITAPNQRAFYPWNTLWTEWTDTEPLEYARNRFITQAGADFARKRDKTRFININGAAYGFECTNKAITNFISAKDTLRDQLEAWDGAGEEPSIYIKVLNKSGESVGVNLTLAQMKQVQEEVRKSQLEAYNEYNELKTKLEQATSTAALEALYIMTNGEEKTT